MKKYILIFALSLLPLPAVSQGADDLDAFRRQYVEIVGEDGLSSNLTSATCPVDKSVRTFSFKEFMSILYDNPLTFYGIESSGSELQKKMLRESPEFKQKNANFNALRNKVLSKPFMVVKPLQDGSHYSLEKKKFECEFKTISDYNKETGRFNLGCVSLYDPSIKVLYYVDRYVRTANLYQHVFIDVPSEEAALDIEQNLSDCALCVIFNYQQVNPIDVVIYKHYQIHGKPVKCCVVNTRYGFVYDSNWKTSKSRAYEEQQRIQRQKEEAERLERIWKEEERLAALKLEEQTILDEINSGKQYRPGELYSNPYISIPDSFTDRLNTVKDLPSTINYDIVVTAEGSLSLMFPSSLSEKELEIWDVVRNCVIVTDPGKIRLPSSGNYLPVPVRTHITIVRHSDLVSGGYEVKVKYNKKLGIWQVQNSSDIRYQLNQGVLRSNIEENLEMIRQYFAERPEFDVMDKKPVVCECAFYKNTYTLDINNLCSKKGRLKDTVEIERVIKPVVGGR